MQFNPFAIPTFLSALLGWGLLFFVLRQSDSSIKRPLSFLLLAVSWWASFYSLELLGTDLSFTIFCSKLQYMGIVIVPMAWLAFTFAYAGRPLPSRFETAAIAPILTLLTAWAYPALRWVWSDAEIAWVGTFAFMNVTHGLGFWIFIAYTYLFLLWGALVMFRAFVASHNLFRVQGLILTAATLIPWLGNAIYIFGLSPVPYYDLTPVVFVFSAVLLVWGNYAFSLLDIVPVARDVVMDNLADPVVVLDLTGRVVDLNEAAIRLLALPAAEVLGKTLVDLLPEHQALFEHYRTHIGAHDEVPVKLRGREFVFELHLTPVYDRRKVLCGRVVILRDITERKRLERALTSQINLFENLLAVARATSAQPALEDTLRNTLDIAVALTRSERGSILLVNRNGQVTHQILARGDLPAYVSREIVNQVLEGGLAGWLIRYGQIALLEDTARDERWLTLPDQPYQVGSVLGIPIKYVDEILGVLILMHAEPYHYTQRDVEVMSAATQQMALAVRNAQIFYEQQRMAERQMILFEVLRSAQETLTVQQTLRRMLRTLAQLTDWPLVALLEPDESGERWAVGVWEGRLTPPSDWALIGEPPDAEKGRVCLLGQVTALPGFPEVASFMYAPLQADGRVTYVLLVGSDQPYAFSDDDRALIAPLADVIALSLRNAYLFEQVGLEQRRLQALIQSSNDGIVMLSLDRKVLVVNQQALNHLALEHTTPADWLNRPVEEVFRALWHRSPKVVRVLAQELRRVRNGNEPAAEGEYEIGGRILTWANLPVLDEAGAALGRLVVLRDVTPIRQAERLREDLIHTMVHDLRNPLTAVRGSLQLLVSREKDLSQGSKQLLDLAFQGSTRMLDLVNAILDVGRLESGRMPLNLEAIDFRSLVSEVVALQQPLAVQRQLRLELDVPYDLPSVRVDQALISRVLQNLIGNAIKFTPAGGRITISARRLEGAQPLEVQVQDTGPGIPPELKARLFGKFVTGNVEGRGSGLGLAFCKLALEAHGQSIRVESEVGAGTTFIFTLPLAEEGGR